MLRTNSTYEQAIGGYGADSTDDRSVKGKWSSKLSRVRNAFKKRKDDGWDQKATEFIQVYSNKYPWDELNNYQDVVAPNMAFSTVNTIVPMLAVHAPKITVEAKREQDREAAMTVEAVVNHQWEANEVQEEIREAVKDFVIIGLGWVKSVWETEIAERELSVPEWQEQVRSALMERANTINESMLNEDEFPSEDDVIAGINRTVEEIVRDSPKVTRVSPFDMIVDPDALRLKDARWIAQRSFVPLEEAKKNTAWNSRVRSKLTPSVMSKERDVDVDGNTKDMDEAAFVIVYEYYDLLSGEMCVFSESGDGFLQSPVKSPFPDVHPFIPLFNYDVPERFAPIGDIETVFGLMLELAMTRTQMINDRKAGRRIHLYRPGAIGPEGVEALESEQDEVLIEVLEDRPFGDVIGTVPHTALHPEWYNQSQMILEDINMITGVSEYARGVMPDIKRTATEAGLIQDAANARSADKQWKVEQMMARVAKSMIRLTQMYMEGSQVAKVVDDNMVQHWIEFTSQDLMGDFTFKVEAGSTQPQNETFRRQSALQLMDVMSPMIGSGMINDQKLIEHVLRNGFGIKNATDFLGPGPQPPPPEPGMEGMPPEQMPPGMPPGVPPEMMGAM